MQAYKEYVSEKSRLSQRAREAGERSNRAKKINPHKHSRAEVESIKNNSNGIEKGFAQQRKVFDSRLNRLNKVEKPLSKTKLMLQNPVMVRPGKPVITALDVTVSQGERELIQHVTLKVETGQRLAVMGKNGSGKTTLINRLLQGGPGITHADKLRISYANQDLRQLDASKTALANIMLTTDESEQIARNFLGAMGIRLEQVNELVGDMSGGERVRVALVKALLQASDLLILDEPTNYLDIPALEALTAYLQTTKQAVIFVSHDDQFVRDVATEVFEISEGSLLKHTN